MQTHFPAPWVTPGPSGQRDPNLGLTTLGIDPSHLGFAVLSSALVAIAHPVPGADSHAARGVRLTDATSLDVSHTPTPVRTDGGRPAPRARPRRWSGGSERGGRRGSP